METCELCGTAGAAWHDSSNNINPFGCYLCPECALAAEDGDFEDHDYINETEFHDYQE